MLQAQRKSKNWWWFVAIKGKLSFCSAYSQKAEKIGTKVWVILFVESKYTLNGFPIQVCISAEQQMKLNDYIVKRLAEEYLKKGRNINTDTRFISVTLCEKLTAKILYKPHPNS